MFGNIYTYTMETGTTNSQSFLYNMDLLIINAVSRKITAEAVPAANTTDQLLI